mgnify:CR=1 FL=1
MTYYDWFLKLIFTVVTLAIGFQGGEVTPLFSIGATLGFILAPIFHLPIELCVALGYTGVLLQQQYTFSTNDDRFRSLLWASNDSISYYMYFCLFS